ncbi:hypothetical protein FQR65_LT03899 [Abscondita terminalis]|nr:hypothetical protein FQR65_LT03899 [Abscondita terminalis]
MTHKLLTQNELEDILRDMFNDPEQDEETNFTSSDSNFLEEEIGKQDDASSTDQENIFEESEEEEEPMEEIFIGKNKSTEWRKRIYRVSRKTKKINVVTASWRHLYPQIVSFIEENYFGDAENFQTAAGNPAEFVEYVQYPELSVFELEIGEATSVP